MCSFGCRHRSDQNRLLDISDHLSDHQWLLGHVRGYSLVCWRDYGFGDLVWVVLKKMVSNAANCYGLTRSRVVLADAHV
jgi:hypothetical protein